MTERDALVAAEAVLREHQASWAYAFAHAGGCHGGADHPDHRATRDRTQRLLSRVRAARTAYRTSPTNPELPDHEH